MTSSGIVSGASLLAKYHAIRIKGLTNPDLDLLTNLVDTFSDFASVTDSVRHDWHYIQIVQ